MSSSRNPLRELPEVAALDEGRSVIRLPQELDAPLTRRVQAVIDSAPFRRLAGVSQTGLVTLVYPGSRHHRFEHSLGVYRLALLFLKHLSYDERFAATVSVADAERFILAALLHDVGHWPFCHPIEDMGLPGVPRHETQAAAFLTSGDLAEVIRTEWNHDPRDVWRLLDEPPASPAEKLLQSLLSGPIDIDKMDYLNRDSLHAGVPYGRNFDQGRLINSLCLNAAGDGLAIQDKGKTAAELMVFARYVMFSEVYWHHGVRSATAMLQRAFDLLFDKIDRVAFFRLTESSFCEALLTAAEGTPAASLVDGIFGPTRRLYKRVAQYSLFESGELYRKLARRPYRWLARCAEQIAARLSSRLGEPIESHEILLDAPPQTLEVQFHVDVFFPKEGRYRKLDEVSPVVRSLAHEQFDDYVKRVRLFSHPRLAERLRGLDGLADVVAQAAEDAGPSETKPKKK